MKITNKDIIQSYIVTTAKYDYSVYEKRILFRLVELFQKVLKGEKLSGKIKANKDLFGDYHVTMPISAFLKDEKDNNYARAKKALEDLESKKFTYEDDRIWEIIRIIQNPVIEKFNDTTTFRINPKIFEALSNFSKGYRKFELSTVMSFESTYSMRFYELLSEKKSPITYSINNLKIMFKLENKYSRVNDFIKRTVDVAKKELDEKSPYSFEYSPVKTGRKITAIKFYPVYNAANRDEEIERKKAEKNTSLRWDLDRMIIQYLKENYLFDEVEIMNNKVIFVTAQNEPRFDLMYFLSEQKRNAEKKANPKGWIIGAIKKQLENLK